MSRQQHRIIGVGLLTEQDIRQLGEGFDRWFPVDETPCFGGLLAAIDEADRALRIEREELRLPPRQR